MTTMVVEIRGRDLPGRRCGPGPDGGSYVHAKRGERHLGLRWGTLEDDGTFMVHLWPNLQSRTPH